MPILYLASELQSVDTECLLEYFKNAICMANDNQEKLLKLVQCPFNQCILIFGKYVISDQVGRCKPYPDSHQHTIRCQNTPSLRTT